MGLDSLAKRYAPLAVCLMLAIAAYFQASGMTQLIGALLAPASMIAAPRPPAVHFTFQDDLQRDVSAAAILDRNPFDSVTGPLKPALDLAAHGADNSPSADWYADAPCDIARVVLIASSTDDDWSFAAIMGPDGKTTLHRRGDDFYGGKVTFVGDHRPDDEKDPHDRRLWDRVWLTGPTGQRCVLKLGAVPKMMSGAPPPSAPHPPGPNGDLMSKIRRTGEHAYDVDRTAVDALIANPAELMKVRVIPEKEGDRVVGLRLQGIKPNSLLGAIGIENGDRLTSINGFEMNDPQKMLEAYSKLLRADHLTASVVRGGRPVNLDFNIK